MLRFHSLLQYIPNLSSIQIPDFIQGRSVLGPSARVWLCVEGLESLTKLPSWAKPSHDKTWKAPPKFNQQEIAKLWRYPWLICCLARARLFGFIAQGQNVRDQRLAITPLDRASWRYPSNSSTNTRLSHRRHFGFEARLDRHRQL